jgi:hypothetical protein
LNPETIIKRFYPKFSYQKVITGTREKVSEINQFGQIITIVSVLMVFVLSITILVIVPKTKEFAKKKFREFKEQMFYNGIIRTVQISHMK